MNDEQLLALAVDLVQQAAAVIMTIRNRGFSTSHKPDASVVTEADHAAEQLIAAGLRAATPDIAVIAEEEVAAGHREIRGSSFWLVDPLDGTREFAQMRDEFAVNIGLVRDHHVVLGAVAVPAHGEIFAGIVGRGATRRDGRGEHPISARFPPAAGLDVIASRHYANDPELAKFLNGRPIASLKNAGSALKFCRVAEGVADLYPRLGRTMEWDTAAPQAVLEAAGGSVKTLDGVRLGYAKPGFENPHFICTGR
jgi:3'(2'), 5'-bisphosphate nucleotidase